MDHQCYARKKPLKKRETHNCCVPQCPELKNPSIHMHIVPNDAKRKKEWAIAIKTGKALSSRMRVCSKHFTKEDYIPSLGKKVTLKKTAVPSQNLPRRTHEKPQPSPVKRKKEARADRARKRTLWCDEHNELQRERSGLQSGGESFESTDDENDNDGSDYEWMDIPEVSEADIETSVEIGVQVGTYDANAAFVNSILSSDGKLYSATGLHSISLLNSLTSCFDRVAPENPKKKFLLCTRDRILLAMMKIKLSLSFSALAVFFDTSVQNASNYFQDTVRVLALILRIMVSWPVKEKILEHMPKCFAQFRATRAVLDCFELFVDKPKCVKCRVRLYSQYKKGFTVKFLLCCAPSGLITKVSKAYGGRASDKFITAQAGVYSLCEFGDGLMVDKGFAIEEECQQHLLTLIRPPFLRNKKKFTRAEAVECAKIARARVHVERAIQRMRDYGFLRNKLQWRLVPVLDDVVTIVSALVNLGRPILAEDKFVW